MWPHRLLFLLSTCCLTWKCVTFQALTSRCFIIPSWTESRRWSLGYNSIADIVSPLPVDTLFLGIKRIDHSMSGLLIVSWHSMPLDLWTALHCGHRHRQLQASAARYTGNHCSSQLVAGNRHRTRDSISSISPPVLHLQLLAFLASLLHLLTYLPLLGRRVCIGLVCQYSL